MLPKRDFAADGSLLTYAIPEGKALGDQITITLKASCANYEDFTITLHILLREKDDQAALRVTGGTTVVYGETLQLGSSGGSGTGKAAYAVTNGTGEAVIDPDTGLLTPVKVGIVTVTVTKAEEDVEAIAADICTVLDDALAAYNTMRAVEGEKLALDVSSRVDTIEETVSKVEAQSPQTVAAYRQRLEAKMQEVLQSTTIDESRILTEAAIFADKVAVDEETVRLRSHIAQLRDMLQSGEPVGRKLDFLIQEVNRECNTIGSKCNDLTVARDVVNMKAEVEKIREQVQNME